MSPLNCTEILSPPEVPIGSKNSFSGGAYGDPKGVFTIKDLVRFHVIQLALQKKISNAQGASQLGLSVRQFIRLKKKVLQKDPQAFLQGWEKITDDGREEAAFIYYQPTGWPEEETYVVGMQYKLLPEGGQG